MIERSRFFKAMVWICILLAFSICTYDIGLAQSTDPARPDTTRLAVQNDDAQPDAAEDDAPPEPEKPSKTWVRLKGKQRRPDGTPMPVEFSDAGADSARTELQDEASLETTQSLDEMLQFSTTGEMPPKGETIGTQPIYGRWWFWAIGATLLGTTLILLMDGEAKEAHEELPDFPPPPEG